MKGSFSDQRQHQIGTRLPLISLGAVLAAGLFGVIPTVLVGGQGPLRWGLPLLLIAWATAMAVFRSPVLSLLGRYALGTQLPQAASILTLVGGLSGALGPLAGQFILGLGPFVAFTLGSAVLLLATLTLWWAGPNNRRAMVLGLSAMASLAILVGVVSSTAVGMVLAALFGAALSLVNLV